MKFEPTSSVSNVKCHAVSHFAAQYQSHKAVCLAHTQPMVSIQYLSFLHEFYSKILLIKLTKSINRIEKSRIAFISRFK